MLINTEVTEKDYRALQWSVLIDRSKLPLGLAACLPVAALLLWFSRGADESTALALRVFAFIIGGVGLLLLAIIAGAYFTRNKPLGDKRVPLGPHTYEVSETSILVTSDQRRMEVPVTALQYVTVTPSHFFVVPRQGTDLIIPRRGLDARQADALLRFCDAVTLSSSLIDRLRGKPLVPVKEIARSFMILRWAPLLLAVALSFTFSNGLIHTKALWYAFAGGVLWLSAMLLYMRTRRAFWIAGLYLLPLFLKDVSGIGLRSPGGHYFQWLLLLALFASLPVFLFPRFFRRLARISEAGEERQVQA